MTPPGLGFSRRVVLIAVLVFALVPYLVQLGGSSIWDANEAFYVETPREMMERSDYINPTFNYEPRFNKPVFSYWIVAAFYHVFWVSVGVQRVPIAIGAFALVAIAFALARTASSHRDAPLLAATGLAAAPRLFILGRRIFIDIYITAFMGLTLLCFALAERYRERRRTWLALMYVCVGLGVLTKGPVAAVLPALVFAGYLAFQRELHRVRDMMLARGTLIVLVIVVPWYAALYVQHGWKHIVEFFIGENIGRYTSGIGSAERGPLFYAPVVFSDSLPISLFLPMAGVLWFADRRVRREEPEVRIRTLLWLWIVVTVVFFSFSQTKQDLYVFPIVVAVAALGGDAIARGLDDVSRSATWLRGSLVVLGCFLLISGGLIVYLFEAAGRVYLLDGLQLIVGCLLAGGTGVVLLAARRRFAGVVLATAVCAAFNWLLVLQVLPSFERYKPVRPLSNAILRLADADDVIAHYDVALPSMVFYLKRHIEVYFDRDAFLRRMQSGHEVLAVLPDHQYRTLEPKFGLPTCVLARQPMSDFKLRRVLSRETPPEILLITNACDR